MAAAEEVAAARAAAIDTAKASLDAERASLDERIAAMEGTFSECAAAAETVAAKEREVAEARARLDADRALFGKEKEVTQARLLQDAEARISSTVKANEEATARAQDDLEKLRKKLEGERTRAVKEAKEKQKALEEERVALDEERRAFKETKKKAKADLEAEADRRRGATEQWLAKERGRLDDRERAVVESEAKFQRSFVMSGLDESVASLNFGSGTINAQSNGIVMDASPSPSSPTLGGNGTPRRNGSGVLNQSGPAGGVGSRWAQPSIVPPLGRVLANAVGLEVQASPLPYHAAALESWAVDAYAVAAEVPSPLQSYATAIAAAWGIADVVVPLQCLQRFIAVIDAAYADNPYHNRVHAADILQSTFALVHHCPTLLRHMSPTERLALLLAAACHDVQHPGRSNAFLVATNDPLAVRYGNRSVLEHHHLAAAFDVMRNPACDVTCMLGAEAASELRALMAGLILSTDMSKHVTELDAFEERRRQHSRKAREDIASAANNGNADSLDAFYADKANRHATLALLMHAADISSLTKPIPVAKKWTAGILKEMSVETSEAKARGLKGVPMMGDDIPRGQLFFIDTFVAPIYHIVVDEVIETPMTTVLPQVNAPLDPLTGRPARGGVPSSAQDPLRCLADVRRLWALQAGVAPELPPRRQKPPTAEDRLANAETRLAAVQKEAEEKAAAAEALRIDLEARAEAMAEREAKIAVLLGQSDMIEEARAEAERRIAAAEAKEEEVRELMARRDEEEIQRIIIERRVEKKIAAEAAGVAANGDDAGGALVVLAAAAAGVDEADVEAEGDAAATIVAVSSSSPIVAGTTAQLTGHENMSLKRRTEIVAERERRARALAAELEVKEARLNAKLEDVAAMDAEISALLASAKVNALTVRDILARERVLRRREALMEQLIASHGHDAGRSAAAAEVEKRASARAFESTLRARAANQMLAEAAHAKAQTMRRYDNLAAVAERHDEVEAAIEGMKASREAYARSAFARVHELAHKKTSSAERADEAADADEKAAAAEGQGDASNKTNSGSVSSFPDGDALSRLERRVFELSHCLALIAQAPKAVPSTPTAAAAQSHPADGVGVAADGGLYRNSARPLAVPAAAGPRTPRGGASGRGDYSPTGAGSSALAALAADGGY